MKQQLSGIPVGDVLVSRQEDTLKVVVFTSKAALITGKTGENSEAIEKKLSNKLGMPAKLEVKEIGPISEETDLELGQSGDTVTLADGATAVGFGTTKAVSEIVKILESKSMLTPEETALLEELL